MTVSIRLFAAARDAAGCSQTALDLPDGASVGAAWDALGERFPKLKLFPVQGLAVNRSYADAADTLLDGDELAVIPPVSGG